jgi:hypothetical protein
MNIEIINETPEEQTLAQSRKDFRNGTREIVYQLISKSVEISDLNPREYKIQMGLFIKDLNHRYLLAE